MKIRQPWVACAFTLPCASRASCLLGLPFPRGSLKLYSLGLGYPASRGPSIFLGKSYLRISKCLCSQGRVGNGYVSLACAAQRVWFFTSLSFTLDVDLVVCLWNRVECCAFLNQGMGFVFCSEIGLDNLCRPFRSLLQIEMRNFTIRQRETIDK